MIIQTHEILMDVTDPRVLDSGITLVRNDTKSNVLRIRFAGVDDWTGAIATIKYWRADQTVVVDALAVVDGYADHVIPAAALGAAGKLICEVSLARHGVRATTNQCVLQVRADIDVDAAQADDRFPALDKLIAEASAYNGHFADKNNPHGVTAAQVGTASGQSVEAELSKKVTFVAEPAPENDLDNGANGVYQIVPADMEAPTNNAPTDFRWGACLCTIFGQTRQQLGIDCMGKLAARGHDGMSWTAWEPIATATPPLEFEFPFAAGIARFAQAHYFKAQDGVTTLNLSFRKPDYSPIASGTIIGTLPLGYRPTINLEIPIATRSGGIGKIDVLRNRGYADDGIVKLIMLSGSCDVAFVPPIVYVAGA